MSGTVSTASIICMMISCIIGFAIPVVLYIYFRKKTGADTAPFFIGCGVFLIFALLLENGVNQIILGSPAGRSIQENTLKYALFGGLSAGLFEEFGRLLAFKTLLRSYQDKDANALMYGAGHGGFESMMLLGLTMINNIAYATTVNEGKLAQYTESMTPDMVASLEDVINQLITTPSWMFLVGGIERVLAVILQISLSVLVWFAVTRLRKFHYFPIAILLHALVDATAVILSRNGMNVIAVEAVIALMTAAVAFYTWKQWQINRT